MLLSLNGNGPIGDAWMKRTVGNESLKFPELVILEVFCALLDNRYFYGHF